MNREEIKAQTKAFADRSVRECEARPDEQVARGSGRQPSRSGTSLVTDYRAGYRAKSTTVFMITPRVVKEEGAANLFWMERLVDGSLVKRVEFWRPATGS